MARGRILLCVPRSTFCFLSFVCAALAAGELLGQVSNGLMPAPPGTTATNRPPPVSPEKLASELAKLRAKAEKGDPLSQCILGDAYIQGRVVQLDRAEAAKWYRKSAEHGFPPGQFNLGLVYEKGEGVPQDPAEAVKWYRKAAKKGFIPAEYNLGLMLLKGQGVGKDSAQGADWIKKAADHNDTLAQVALAGLYMNGDGVPGDKVEAYAWLSMVVKRPELKDDGLQIACLAWKKDLTPAQLTAAESRSQVLEKEIRQRTEAETKAHK